MKAILIYDSSDNTNRLNKICKKYLNWIQNSCFEGDITVSKLKELKKEIKDVSCNKDSIIIFEMVTGYNKYIIGEEKNKIDNFI